MKHILVLLVALAGCLGFFLLGRSARAARPLDPPPTSSQPAKSDRSDRPTPPPSSDTDWLVRLQKLETRHEFIAAFQEQATLLPDPEAHDQLLVLADYWAAQSPEDAVAWLAALEFDDARNPFLFPALSQWARLSPQAARSWLVRNHPQANETQAYLNAALIRGLAQVNPNEALDQLLDSPPSPERRGSLDFLLTEWANEGLAHTFDQVLQLPEAEKQLRQHALQKLFTNLLPDELPEASRRIEKLADASEQTGAATTLATHWAHHDAEQALRWASELKSPGLRAKAIGAAALGWSREAPFAASRWLDDKTSPAYDYAQRAVASTIIAAQPEEALAQIARITNHSLREESFEQLGRIWLSKNPQGFLAVINRDSNMPAAIRDKLLQHFR
ncbi:MAG: hypothetical protein Q7Q71_15195 [Verrucomicrobiota bacterium JB023]|nr:hypothetical protein [Verrucomicrobiota bacterium JB023]